MPSLPPVVIKRLLAMPTQLQGVKEFIRRDFLPSGSAIALGTNLSPKASERAPQITQIRRLMDVALAQSDLCIWVGPPNMRRSPDFDQQGVENKVSMIQEVQNRCTFIDSRMISQYPSQGDGIHYHWPGSRNIEQIQASSDWANAVMQEVESIISQN